MRVQRAYKTELDLNDLQVTACRQHAGAARWAYNWGLRVKQERYRASTKSPTAIALHRELNALKKTAVPWMYQVSKCAPQEALWNLDAAFQQFFRRCALKKQGKWKGKLGYPQVKTKKKGLGSFRLTGRIVVSEKAIVLPRLGHLRIKEREYLPTAGVQILSATVSEQAGHWYVIGAGGGRALRAREYRSGGRDRSGGQEPGYPLRWRGNPQSAPPQAASQEAQAAATGSEPPAEGRQEPEESGTRAGQAPSAVQASTPQHPASGHHQAGENQVSPGDRRPECRQAC